MIASAKGAHNRLSEEERMVRNHELELLTKISKPPEKEGVLLEALVMKHREHAAEEAKTAAAAAAAAAATSPPQTTTASNNSDNMVPEGAVDTSADMECD